MSAERRMVFNVDLEAKCPRCGKPGAMNGGPCLSCCNRSLKALSDKERASRLRREAAQKEREARKVLGARPNPRKVCRDAAMKLTRERRQEVLDALKAGGATVGETRERFGLSQEELSGIIEMNMVKTVIHTWRKESL